MESVVGRIVDYAAHVSEPEKIILFGSMAGGIHDVYSDIDLLIILGRGQFDPQIAARVTKYAEELSMRADVLVCSSDEIEDWSQVRGSFLAAILRGGKIVYEKSKKGLERAY